MPPAMTDTVRPHAADRLQAAMDANRSIACVGLDPRPALLPPPLLRAAREKHGPGRQAVCAAFQAFNRGLIDAIAGRCAAIKPQMACYEAYGAPGVAVLEDTVQYAHAQGLPVILDGKRNDIGSTATHYQQAWLGAAPGLGDGEMIHGPGADWLTINAWLGGDGVKPFLSTPPGQGGVFVLVRTSNPGAAEIQGQRLAEGGLVMEAMARLVAAWGKGRQGACGLTDVGAVVGATWPDEARALRALMPDTLFLVPGYGAQGGSAADALAGRRSDGRGVLVNSSRGIIGAWQQAEGGETRWQEAVTAALEAMNRDLGG